MLPSAPGGKHCCIMGVWAANAASAGSAIGGGTARPFSRGPPFGCAPAPASGRGHRRKRPHRPGRPRACARRLRGRAKPARRRRSRRRHACTARAAHQLRVDLRVAGHHFALVEVVGLAGEVADQAAGLGDHQRAGGDVPGAEPGLEEAVVVAGGDVAQVERGGARAAQAGAALHHVLEHLQVALEVVALAERKAGADQRVGQAQCAWRRAAACR